MPLRGRIAAAAILLVVATPPAADAQGDADAVGALGRIEPLHGVRRIAGPPRPVVVIDTLYVEEGDRVEKGQVLAELAGASIERAEVARLEAELANAERELERNRALRGGNVVSESEFRRLELVRDVARAGLARARAALALLTVRAPLAGTVLDVHARAGERVGEDGIVEIGDTDVMVAVAEVYETDIGRVHEGQHAQVRSPALQAPLHGTVKRIGLKIGKQDVLGTDPVDEVDARVVEVEIHLDEPERAAALTNLRVDVVIGP